MDETSCVRFVSFLGVMCVLLYLHRKTETLQLDAEVGLKLQLVSQQPLKSLKDKELFFFFLAYFR